MLNLKISSAGPEPEDRAICTLDFRENEFFLLCIGQAHASFRVQYSAAGS